MSKIEINNVYKIFGNDPKSVLPMVKDGATKDEILEKTGHTVGLDNVSLKIEEGETFVCMGLSGSGKSTLIRHLNRLIDPTDGEILVEGTNVMDLDPKGLIEFRRHKMSMVFQRFGLFPHKTVLENVGYGLEGQGQKPEERNKTAMEKIEAVGLTGFEHQYPNQLSGGMQQRVGLARALATNTSPEVGSINRLMCRIKVDFPEPDKPIHTNVSPSSIDKETLSRPTVCPVFSNTSSLLAPSWTIGRTFVGLSPNIL